MAVGSTFPIEARPKPNTNAVLFSQHVNNPLNKRWSLFSPSVAFAETNPRRVIQANDKLCGPNHRPKPQG